MNTCAIVELEEAALSITVAELRGRRVQVVRNVHVPIPDLEPSTLVSILSSLRSDVLRGIAAVQVILGDRRMHHFRCEVPAMPVADVEQFVRREAMRLTGLPSVDDVLIAVNRLRRTSNGALRIAATALPRAVWDTLHKSFVEAGVTVAGLCSLENCLALLAPTAAPTAVVECGVGRTRFLLCEDRVVCQVRRFIVGASAGGNSEAVGAQLSLELPRTLRIHGPRPDGQVFLGPILELLLAGRLFPLPAKAVQGGPKSEQKAGNEDAEFHGAIGTDAHMIQDSTHSVRARRWTVDVARVTPLSNSRPAVPAHPGKSRWPPRSASCG